MFLNEEKLGKAIADKAADRLPAILGQFIKDFWSNLRSVLDEYEITIAAKKKT